MAESSSSSRFLKLLDDRPSDTAPMDCYVCIQVAQRKPQLQQDGPSKSCLLCNNPFCVNHESDDEGVCELNHGTYYSNPDHRARHAPVEIFPTLEEWRKQSGNAETAEGEREAGKN